MRSINTLRILSRCVPFITLFFPWTSFTQEVEEVVPPIKLGLVVESNVSRLWTDGITPGITLKKGRSEFMIGPRIIYKSADVYRAYRFAGDAGYQYTFYEGNAWRVFANLRIEYGHKRWNDAAYYDPSFSDPGDDDYLGEEPFYYEHTGSRHLIGYYAGLGLEYGLPFGFYVKGFTALGGYSSMGNNAYYRQDTEEKVYERSYRLDHLGYSWFTSLGMGYRFGN